MTSSLRRPARSAGETWAYVSDPCVFEEVACRIGAGLKEGRFVARIGGDEFVAIEPNVFARGQAVKFADQLRSLVLDPVDWHNRSLSVACSIGISLFPELGMTPALLCSRADLRFLVDSLARGRGSRIDR
jgi:diguanylate cyclase (GGDEF)-like protein